jgi:nitrate reductase beta subunit
VPAEYLASLFTAGDPGSVRRVLRTLAAVGTFMRAQQLGLDVPGGLAEAAGTDLAEDAGRLMAQHEQLFCAQPGGPDSFHPPGGGTFRDGDGRLHLGVSPRGTS